MSAIELTSQERFLLEWLSKEESSAYGECEGPSLNVLINTGLAYECRLHPVYGYARISLTEAGYALAERLRETAEAATTGSGHR